MGKPEVIEPFMKEFLPEEIGSVDEMQKLILERNPEKMEAFGDGLHKQFETNKTFRRAKELEWLEDLRQYKGLYDPDVKIDPRASKVYPKITRSKVNIVLSRLHEMLFPEQDRNWTAEPTPEPRLTPQVVKQIAQSIPPKINPQTQQPIPLSRADLHLAIVDYTNKRCESMISVMDDQLIEMEYPEETKKVLRSALQFGTGVMKGPMIKERVYRQWDLVPGTEDYEETITTEDIPYYEFVRLWDFYPDMSVVDHDKTSGDFQRHIMNKHDLRLLMQREDFYADIIEQYMADHSDGDYVSYEWEIDLQVIEVEAGQGKNRTVTPTTESDDRNRSTNRKTGKKYEVLEFWGHIDGSDLEACGIEVDNARLEYPANIWLLGKKPIKAAIFDGALKQYKLFYYEKDDTSIFGESLARVMRHSQIAIAAASRMVLDNGAAVSGPQVEVNISLLEPGQDLIGFKPRKVWYRSGRGAEATYPAIKVHNIDSHIDELIMIIDLFKSFGDEETTLPTWLAGQLVTNETAQAASGRLSTITMCIKDIVRNFDKFTEGTISDLYAWNMEFNPRNDIKGDYQIKPRGVSSLVMKEIRMQMLIQFAQTLTPEDWVYFDRREFLIERAKAFDLKLKIKTEEEAGKIREAQENSRARQLAYAQMEAEIGYKKAQSAAQLAKGKDKIVDANLKLTGADKENEGAPPTDPRLTEADLAKKGEEAGAIHDKRVMEADRHAMEMDKTTIDIAGNVAERRQGMRLKEMKSRHDMKMKERQARKSGNSPKSKGEKGGGR